MVEQAQDNRKSSTYVNRLLDHTPYDLGAISCYWLGMYERARLHNMALSLNPAMTG